jgi:hypothetical protein
MSVRNQSQRQDNIDLEVNIVDFLLDHDEDDAAELDGRY